jgi:arylsulfatase A-like enzyme
MQQPSVIIFLTDQQRWDTTGVHGNPLDLTPNFDDFARTGLHVERAFTPQPLCSPARSVIQTGLYATSTGCFRNGIPLPDSCRTLAHFFSAAGYATGYIGKWHLAGRDPVPRTERGGYEYWLGANVLEKVSRPYECVLFDGDGQGVRLPGYRVDAVVDAAIRFISAHGDEPFYLFVSLLEPHQQNQTDSFEAPYGYSARYQEAWVPTDLLMLEGSARRQLPGYYGTIKRIDEAFGRLLDALRSLGLEDDVVVAFSSDHGCHFKTRNREYKRSIHEASIRIPMAFRGRSFNGRGSVQRFGSLADLAPTLLDAAGLDVPEEMHGSSLLGPGTSDEALLVQVSESELGRGLRTPDWKYGAVAENGDPFQDPAATEYVDRYLYDLQADPYELTNLIGRPGNEDVLREMRQRLQDALAAVGEPEAAISPR